jgi:hypothetical protein
VAVVVVAELMVAAVLVVQVAAAQLFLLIQAQLRNLQVVM